MRLSEVVNQIQLVLPKYTDYFASKLTIDTIVASGGVATVTTTVDHDLDTGDGITISEVAQKTPITAVSKDGLVFTFTTSPDNDLTYGFPGYETVSFGGFTNSVWNDSFTLLDVISRYIFKIQSTESLPTLNGNEYLNEVRIDGVNGRWGVTVTGVKTFTITGDFLDGTYLGGTVSSGVRIAGTVSIDRALEQYTKQLAPDLWMFVEMKDASVSKNRSALNDATATIANGEDIRTRIIDGFSIFIIKATKDEVAAVGAVDIARHDLLSPICKSVFGARFSTGLSGAADFVAILTGHNFVNYNRATFIYQYSFEFSSDLTLDDSVINEDTRAFNDINYTQPIEGGNEGDTPDLTIDTIKLRGAE